MEKQSDSPVRMFLDAFGARALLSIASLANVILVTRTVSMSTYGVLVTTTGFVQLLSFLTDMGSSQVMLREGVAPGQLERVSRTYLQVRVILTLATLGVGAAISTLVFTETQRPTAFVALLLLLFSGPTIIFPLAQLRGSMRTVRNASLLQAMLTVLFTVLVLQLKSKATATDLVLAPIAAALVASLYVLPHMARWSAPELRVINWAEVRSMLKSTALLGTSSILGSLYARIDGLLLLRLGGTVEAGLYAAAYRFYDQAKLVPAGAMTPVAPILARELHSFSRMRVESDRAILKLGIYGSVGLVALIAGTAPFAVPAILGERYKETAALLVLVGTTASWSIIAYTATAKTVYAKREARWLAIAGISLAVNVALNLILIPAYSARGAAYATIATELISVALYIAASATLSQAPIAFGLTLAAGVGGGITAASLSTIGTALQLPVDAALVCGGVVCLSMALRVIRRDVPTGNIAPASPAV